MQGQNLSQKNFTRTSGQNNATHKLYVGDNLEAMESITKEYKGKIKCIYMDPPYNTGKQFLYRDSMTSQQNWVDFIKPRLICAKNLLADSGVFFASIDAAPI